MRVLLRTALALAWLCALGCSGDRAEVSGKVLLDGKPIEEGAITFIPIEGTRGPGTGAIIRDGKYHIPASKGVVVGRNRVELRAFRSSGGKIQDPTARRGTLTDVRVPAFGPEYNDESTLVRDIQRGANTLDFDIATASGKSAPAR
jgi:hypothetical protein